MSGGTLVWIELCRVAVDAHGAPQGVPERILSDPLAPDGRASKFRALAQITTWPENWQNFLLGDHRAYTAHRTEMCE